jgi:uncharacterized protein YyaL (SSP411 family)
MIELFWDHEDDAGFYYTAEHHDDVIVRQKETIDNATPAGNSMATELLVRLSLLMDRPDWHDMAGETLAAVEEQLDKAPRAMGQMLQSLDMWLDDPLEIVLVIPEEGAQNRQAMMQVLRETYVRNGVRVLVDLADRTLERIAEDVPLAAERTPLDGQATAYVCQRGTCRQPTTDPEAFADQLRQLRG